MGFVDDVLKKLFKSDSPSEKQTPALRVEAIQRSEQFNASYKNWLAGGELKSLLTNLQNSYQMVRFDDQVSEDFILMNRQGANGFICYGIDDDEIFFLIDYLKEKIKGYGYTLFNSDRNIRDKQDHFMVVERYYLKPQLSNKDFLDKRKQLYGNILLEIESKNEVPKHLKLLSTTYSDRNYEQAFSFDELVSKLFSY